MNHANRSRRARDAAPAPAEIVNWRASAGLTPAEAAALIWCTAEAWGQWERGERRMHPAFWFAFTRRIAERDA